MHILCKVYLAHKSSRQQNLQTFNETLFVHSVVGLCGISGCDVDLDDFVSNIFSLHTHIVTLFTPENYPISLLSQYIFIMPL